MLRSRLFTSESAIPDFRPPEKPPSPNAFDLYRSASLIMVDGKKVVEATATPANTPGARIDHHYTLEEKSRLLARNGPALRKMREGFHHVFLDPHPGDYKASGLQVVGFRELSRLLVLEGQMKAGRGDHAGAMADFLDAVRFAEQIQRRHVLIGMLVGIACGTVARRNAWETLEKLDAGEAKNAARRMEAVLKLQTTLSEILQGEKEYILTALRKDFPNFDAKGNRITPLTEEEKESTDENEPTTGDRIARYGKEGTLDRYRSYMNGLISNASRPYPDRKRKLVPENGMLRQFMYLTDPIGYRMGSLNENAGLKKQVSLTQNALLTAALALQAYRKEKERYPDALPDLIPRYLSEIPSDPFARRERLLYHRSGPAYTLYSVGPDGKDDGGRPLVNPPTGDPAEDSKKFATLKSRGDMVAGVNFY